MNSSTTPANSGAQPELIRTFQSTIGGVPATCSDAREVHAFLDVSTKFIDWIKTRIEDGRFVENKDFSIVSEKTETIRKYKNGTERKGITTRIEYHISLRMAKHLGMMERSDKGTQVRDYYLAMEDKALAAAGQVVPPSHTETLLPSEQQTLSEIAHRRAEPYGANQGKVLAEIWSRLHNKFRIAKYNQLPRTQLADAIVYVTSMELRTKPDIAPELMNSNDMNNLSRMVWLLCHDVRFESSWRHAIWRLFRRVSNTPAPKPFEVRHIPVLAEECRRVWHIVSRFHDAVHQAEKVVIKRVLHNDEDASVVLEQISAALMKAATEDAQQADGYLKRWGEDEIGGFALRKPMMQSDTRYLES